MSMLDQNYLAFCKAWETFVYSTTEKIPTDCFVLLPAKFIDCQALRKANALYAVIELNNQNYNHTIENDLHYPVPALIWN